MKSRRSFWLTAVLIPLAASWFFHHRGKSLAALIAIAWGIALITLRFIAPSAYDRTIRCLELFGRWISSAVGWLVLAGIYLFIFTPVGLVNRIFRRDPLRSQPRIKRSYWLPMNSGHGKSLRHSFLVESIGPQSSSAEKALIILLKIGALAIILPLADCALGHFVHRLAGGSVIGLFVRPQAVDARRVPWQSQLIAENTAAGGMSYRPYTGYRRNDFRGAYTNIQNGIRLTYRAPLKAAHPKKLYMFGGSTMWGLGVGDQDTLPSAVARLLEKDHVPCIVTNYGELSWNSWQGVLQLADLCASGEAPDAVVFYDGVNDVFAKLQSPEVRRPLLNMDDLARGFSLVSVSGPRALLMVAADVYRRNSLVFDVLHILAEGPARAAAPLEFSRAESVPISDLAAAVLRDYMGTREVVQALAKQYKFRVLFVWQPVLTTKRMRSSSEREILHTTRMLDLQFYGRVYAATSNLVGPQLGCVNLTDAFDDSETYYIDWCHLSERGNQVIAAELYKDIKPLLSDTETRQ